MKTRHTHAFTLIELLVVIAIISIVAALVVNMNARAQELKRRAQVEGEKHSIMLAIDGYQSKLNYYPPDNGNLATTLPQYYDATAATNPLLYELTGATNNPVVNGTQYFNDIWVFSTPAAAPVTATTTNTYFALFGRGAVNNANTDEPHNFFPSVQKKEYAIYYSSAGDTNFCGLTVPVSATSTTFTNFWHYDSSTTNRHNISSYDLWAEYVSGNKNGQDIITTNGNW